MFKLEHYKLYLSFVWYQIMAVDAKNSMSNSSEENTKNINFHRAFFRFAASFLLFVVFSDITG